MVTRRRWIILDRVLMVLEVITLIFVISALAVLIAGAV